MHTYLPERKKLFLYYNVYAKLIQKSKNNFIFPGTINICLNNNTMRSNKYLQ